MSTTLTGSAAAETFWVDNNDIVYGNGGNDIFVAYRTYISGAVIYAGSGNDLISDANWSDLTVYGEDGNDTLSGGYLNSYLDGGEGNDLFRIEKGSYDIYGGKGDDIIRIKLPSTPPVIHIPEFDPANTAKFEPSTIHGDEGIDQINIDADTNPAISVKMGLGYIDLTMTYLTDRTATIRAFDIERITLSDVGIALDLDGNAGKVAKIIGAVFGLNTLHNKEYVGIGLSYLDKGMGYEQLCALAMNATGKTSHSDIVNQLWNNVVGTPIPAKDHAYFVGLLDNGYSVGSLTAFAADSSNNIEKIGLVGLAQTGIEYTPFA